MGRYWTVLLWAFIIACNPVRRDQFPTGELFEAGVSAGVLSGRKADEASGLVASINNPGMLWTHNDSGNDPEIFLMDTSGNIRCTVRLQNVRNRDWEDITISIEAGITYLYIGEIGDNHAVFNYKFLYRFEEPVIPENVSDTTIRQVDKIQFKLSDGARDTEALLADPVSHNFYIFSKRESGVNLYKLTAPLSTETTMTAERVLNALPFTLIVAGDISKDGSEVLAKNYNSIFYWKRNPGESIEDALKRLPEKMPYSPEPQGEAITFNRNGTGFYTLSERKRMPQHLFFYKRK